ncbi:MAG: YdeI/OmpD-associated family protein [Anaerolineales bacterium]
MAKIILDENKLLYADNRKAWRAWLKSNYRTGREVWLVYYKQHTGKARVTYNEAVEEALCFGWIDNTVRRVDEDRYAQRFSPRKPGTPYSQANKERLAALMAKGKVAREVLATLGKPAPKRFRVPPDILEAIKADPAAWNNFRKFSPSYKRIRIAFIDGARNRPAEFQKRLRYFLHMTAKNKQFGFGGIEKYY